MARKWRHSSSGMSCVWNVAKVILPGAIFAMKLFTLLKALQSNGESLSIPATHVAKWKVQCVRASRRRAVRAASKTSPEDMKKADELAGLSSAEAVSSDSESEASSRSPPPKKISRTATAPRRQSVQKELCSSISSLMDRQSDLMARQGRKAP